MEKKVISDESGFTLIEMVLVLFVISVLMLLIVPNLADQKENVDAQGTDALVTVVQTQIELYTLEGHNESVSLENLHSKGFLNQKQYEQALQRLEIVNGIVIPKNGSGN